MFVVIEGMGGSGKSTLAKAICDCRKDAVYWRYPSDGPIGALLRAHTTQKISLAGAALMPLFLADMLQEQEALLKALQAGKLVVCDRYFYSTMVYQNDFYSLGEMAAMVTACQLLIPDRLIFLDLPLEVLTQRLGSRGSAGDRFDEVSRTVLQTYQYRYRRAVQVSELKPSLFQHVTEETSLADLVALV